MDDGRYEFQLGFTQIECPNCGAIRPAAVVCASCADPAQSDPLVDRRAALVQKAQKALEAGLATEPVEALTLDDAWQLESNVLDHFMSAVQVAASGGDGAEGKLTAASEELGVLGARLAATKKLRPWVETWRTVEMSFQTVLTVATAYNQSLANPDPNGALGDGESAQIALDEATASLEEFGVRMARWETIESEGTGDPVDNTSLIASLAYSNLGATDPREADARGAELFHRIDESRACPTGLGLTLAMADMTAENIMDRERFWRVAKIVYEELQGVPLLLQLVEDDEWRADMEAALNELNDAGLEAAKMFAVPSARVHVRAALSLGKSLTEIVAKPLLATLLACRGGSTYSTHKQKDIGALLNEAKQAGLDTLTYGLDRAIRDADAHGLFRIEPGGVSFQSGRREYDQLTEAQLEDRVIGAQESVGAMTTGLNAALLVDGVDHARVPTTQFEPEQQVSVMLAVNGIHATSIEIGAETIIHGTGPEPKLPLVAPSAVVPFLPEESESITIALETPAGGVRTLHSDIRALRHWIAAEADLEKQTALVGAMRLSSMDEVPLFESQQVRRWIGVTARDAAGLPAREAIAALRDLRDLAARTGETLGVSAVDGLTRAIREDAQGLGSEDAVNAALGGIERWMDG
jgi:hypothetical protein